MTSIAAPVRLTLVEETRDASPSAPALKIAFATSDQRCIDQHFGAAEAFAIFLVTAKDAAFSEAVSFDGAHQDGNEDKLADRIAALAGCAAVYCCAIGASAIGQLKRHDIEPLKAVPGTTIRAQIALLQEQMHTDPPRWLAKALDGIAGTKRFEQMESEGWVE